jgi:hypothetical protein
MDRREFLRRIRYPAAAVAGGTIIATKAAERGREAGGAALRALNQRFSVVQDQCAALRERMERIEARQKRMLRVVFAVAAVTLGVDVSLLM